MHKYAASFFVRLKKYSGLGALVAIGTTIRGGIEKLVVIPVLVSILGVEAAGEFVWVLSIFVVLGLFAGGGVKDVGLRLQTNYDDAGKDCLIIACLWATIVLSLSGLGVAGLYLGFREKGVISSSDILLLTGLGTYVCLWAMRNTLLLGFHYQLQFGRIALVEIGAGLLLLLAVPFAYLWGRDAAAWGYAVAALVALIYQRHLQKERKVSGGFPGKQIRDIKPLVPTYVLASGLALMSQEAAKFYLGYRQMYSEVIVLLAVEAVVALYFIPVTYLATAIYSIISRSRSVRDFSRSALSQHLISSVFVSASIYGLILTSGPYLVGLFYARVAESAEPLLQLFAVGAAFRALQLFSRGFVYKFANPLLIRLYALVAFALLVVLLGIYVPDEGAYGAGYAIMTVSVISGSVWFCTYLYLVYMSYETKRRGPKITVSDRQ